MKAILTLIAILSLSLAHAEEIPSCKAQAYLAKLDNNVLAGTNLNEVHKSFYKNHKQIGACELAIADYGKYTRLLVNGVEVYFVKADPRDAAAVYNTAREGVELLKRALNECACASI